jgi:hypothetical protein
MKQCQKCGEQSEDQFHSCWRCSTPFSAGTSAGLPESVVPGGSPSSRTVAFEIFRGTFTSWESLCSEAAEFATKIGPQNLITLSHSEDKSHGVVVVWYWKEKF